MGENDRRLDLIRVFDGCEPETLQLIGRLIDEVVFLEERMTELKRLPFIRVHPKDPAMQKATPAAKLYKESMQSYMNAVRILCSVAAKNEPSAEDELLRRLEEFRL